MFNRLKMILSRKKRGSKGPIPTPPDPHHILWEIMHPGKSFEEEMRKRVEEMEKGKNATVGLPPL